MDSSATLRAPQPNTWFGLIVDCAPDPIVVLDDGGRIVVVNRSAESMFGYGRAELIDQPLGILFPHRSHDIQLDITAAADVACATEAWNDLTGLRKDGVILPIAIALNRIEAPTGRFTVACIADMTERKRAETAQQQMVALVESADDAILTKTLDGIIRSWNPAAERLMGYRGDEMIGKPVTILIPNDRQEEELMILEQIRQGRRVAHFETVRRRSDGSLVDVSLTISPVRDRSGKIVGASKIMRDITDRRRALEQLQMLNAELELQILARTSELKERKAMLQEIHHRVKNNLQVISSLISMQVRSIGNSEARSALRQCQSRIATMAQIHEMLYQANDYARIPFAKFAKDLATRVRSALDIHSSAVTLEFELEDLLLAVDTAIPCGLILNEVVANALKHAFPAGTGEIKIVLRRTSGGRVLLAVSDNGIGMPRESMAEAGSSMGMQIVTTLVEQLDGRLEIIRHAGTTFQITFLAELRP